MYIWVDQQGWQPWANTVAYYPLDTDFNDDSWNSRNLTNTGATITTVSWVTCAYFDGNSYAQFDWYSLANTARTVNIWVDCTLNGWYQWAIHISDYYTNSPWWSLWIKFNNWNTNVWPWDWQNASAETVTATVTAWWHNIIVTQASNVVKLYVDGDLIWTNNWYPITWWWTTPDSWCLWSKDWPTHSEKLTWYLSKVILEDKVWTDGEVQDYFDNTKAIYWLS